ncbi:MAG: ABC transporter ATP-binding protein [Suilimivivens sp.]
MREPIISFKDYTYHYRAQAEPTIHNINLEINRGERIIIVGPSGCGKSTLAHCLNGLNPFSYPGESTGTLTICGVNAAKSSIFELSQFVGTVLQDTDGQFIGMTVLEDIAFSMENDCVPQEEMIRRTHEEAGKVSLLEKLQAAPHELSGGQKQRVSMAGVMINQAPVLLFDEPLANLDPAAGKDAIELIDQLQKDGEKTVIIIEHRLEDAMHMGADRIILMENGRIINDSAPEDLFLSDKLIKAGIREPLYLTALKYAGISLVRDMHVERMQDLKLEESHKAQIRKWFSQRKEKEPAKEKPEVLRVEGIHFGYTPEKENLTDISFSVREGEMVSIVGKNGAGKSTMAKLLCGFEKPDKGNLYYKGSDMSGDTIKERAAHIGYVMQNPNQMISKPMIFEEVALSLTLQKLPEEEIKQRVYDTLKICGLYEFRNWPVNALSYGQKKRVTIASILVSNPQILILDEPTAGQDFRHYTEIMEFLRELNEKGITVLMITHDMHLMLEYTGRSLVFADGRKIADTTPEALFSDPLLLKKASLKETSLYELAGQCDLSPESYIRAFIEYDREVRA